MTQPQFYVVGGAVRDAILGVKPTDIDYLVVGATPEWMLQNGYTQVGADFPVFLKNGEEYALARTERKTGAGYHGFETNSDPSVTLEQDLERRDLTVNSMAVELKYWAEFQTLCAKYRTSLEADFLDEYVHNWKDHIFNKVIMMNGGAFKEDPVRVFRAVRMRHTLPEGEGCQFVADEWDYSARTWKAMEEMVASDDFKELTPERVAQEILKAASKCKNYDQFAGFISDLQRLNVPTFTQYDGFYGFPYNAKNLDGQVEGGLTDRDAVAYMMLCMRNHPIKMIKDMFKARRYSNDAVSFGLAVYAIEEAYGENGLSAARGLIDGHKFFELLYSTSCNHFPEAVQFLAELELVDNKYIELLLKTYDLWKTVSIDALTEEQRQTLQGAAIGQAVWDHRVSLLDQAIEAQSKAVQNN